MNGLLQKVGFRDEIGVQDQQEFPLGHLGGRFQRSGLETGAVRAVNADGVKAAGLQFLHLPVTLFRRIVRGIVQNLDFQLVLGVIQGGDGFQKAVHNELFIEHGKLDRDHGKLPEAGFGLRLVVAVLPVKVNDGEAVKTVAGEAYEDQKIAQEPDKIVVHAGRMGCSISFLRQTQGISLTRRPYKTP